MIKLTKQNYFLPNKALTNSKVKDWLTCKNYFYRKHILNEVERVETDAFKIGAATDDILTQLEDKNKYVVVEGDGRTKEVKELRKMYEEAGNIILNKEQYELVMGLCIAVEESSAFKALKDFKKQHILQVPWDGGKHWDSLGGIPDFYKIADGVCKIVDLKTTTDVDPTRYHFTCLNYKYYQQLGFYSMLLNKIYPEIKEFEYYHLSVEKTKHIYPVRLFRLANDRVEQERENLINNILPQIAKEECFVKEDCSFTNPIVIGSIMQDF